MLRVAENSEQVPRPYGSSLKDKEGKGEVVVVDIGVAGVKTVVEVEGLELLTIFLVRLTGLENPVTLTFVSDLMSGPETSIIQKYECRIG